MMVAKGNAGLLFARAQVHGYGGLTGYAPSLSEIPITLQVT